MEKMDKKNKKDHGGLGDQSDHGLVEKEKKSNLRDSNGRYIKGNYSWSNSLKGKTYIEIYGKYKSKRIKESLSKKGKGRVFSDNHKKNISLSKKGKSWNEIYGKKRADILRRNKVNQLLGKSLIYRYGEDRAKQIIEKRRNKMMGHITTQETKDKIGLSNKSFNLKNGNSLKGKTYIEIYGKERAKEVIKKKSGENHWNKGGTIPEWHKEILRKSRALQIFPVKDTKIEIKIQELLNDLNIEFFTHQYNHEMEKGYQCDIIIPAQKNILKKTVIECFGEYWHNYPIGREIDISRINDLLKNNWRVLIFWGEEIKILELDELKNKLYLNNENKLLTMGEK